MQTGGFQAAKRENISASFTPQQAEFLAACVASGRYQSTSEMVREAVRLLEDQQEQCQVELERPRRSSGKAPTNSTAMLETMRAETHCLPHRSMSWLAGIKKI